jgi:hypothetical protein
LLPSQCAHAAVANQLRARLAFNCEPDLVRSTEPVSRRRLTCHFDPVWNGSPRRDQSRIE